MLQLFVPVRSWSKAENPGFKTCSKKHRCRPITIAKYQTWAPAVDLSEGLQTICHKCNGLPCTVPLLTHYPLFDRLPKYRRITKLTTTILPPGFKSNDGAAVSCWCSAWISSTVLCHHRTADYNFITICLCSVYILSMPVINEIGFFWWKNLGEELKIDGSVWYKRGLEMEDWRVWAGIAGFR